MKSTFLMFLLLLCALFAKAQSQTVRAQLRDTRGQALAFATVALLQPSDSTLQYFGISTNEGSLEIKAVNAGTYLLQVAYIGYKTLFKTVTINNPDNADLGYLILKSRSTDLKEVEIAAERVPFLIKKDTIEYNADAFKTKPDAVVEDLLKKLPGVEVDRAGNVKAQGKDVNRVLVDGKEFFGNDAKIATKNLPADAIKKVQVYDKKSDMAEFTGIDDGDRDKTINLMLKDDKKNGVFGDVQAGIGNDNRFQTSAKAYRFQDKSQFAALGMLNNINQFGFSLQDYMSFKGGMRALSEGGGLQLGGNTTIPVNFGQPVTGLVQSGAAGLNYTYEPRKDHRLNLSYLANGANKTLDEKVNTQNFTPGQNFTSEQNTLSTTKDIGHRVNLNYRNQLDSNRRFTANGGLEISRASDKGLSTTLNQNAVGNQSSLMSRNSDESDVIAGDASLTYLRNLDGNWKLVRIGANLAVNTNLNKSTLNNFQAFFNPVSQLNSNIFVNNDRSGYNANAQFSALRSLGKGYLLEPKIGIGIIGEALALNQGNTGDERLSQQIPTLNKDYRLLRPELAIKRSLEKTQWSILLGVETGQLNVSFLDSNVASNYYYFTPKINFQKELSTGRRIGINYDSRVNTPGANQLMPLANISNPFQAFKGNQTLKPEYQHSLYLNYNLFDQFSFTSLFVNLRGTYTSDKINFSRIIRPDFVQELTLFNAKDDYRLGSGIDFSSPIRKLGININLGLDNGWNKGINLVNGVSNTMTNLSNEFSASISNRKKEKLEVSIGAAISLNQARYTLQQSLNNNYSNLSYFATLNYNISDHFNFNASADVSNYRSQSFNEAVVIPLLKADFSYFFLKGNRGVLTLSAFDILNKNTGLQRISELNYLQERRANIIGRYVMLTFKYRLSKLGANKDSGLNIQIKNR